MSKLYIPTSGPNDWQKLLAVPEKQWSTGFSAKTLAHCWEAAKGLPPEIASMLKPHWGDVEVLLAIPEYKVPLRGSSRGESQSDVFVLARGADQTLAITVEGKVNEPFGETVGDWLQNASDGKRERIAFICELLGLTQPLPPYIHYQLLHRTASAVILAQQFKTDAAAMIVHSFSRERKWFDAFVQFASLFGAEVKPDELIAICPNGKPPLYIGWACGDCNFLASE